MIGVAGQESAQDHYKVANSYHLKSETGLNPAGSHNAGAGVLVYLCIVLMCALCLYKNKES